MNHSFPLHRRALVLFAALSCSLPLIAGEPGPAPGAPAPRGQAPVERPLGGRARPDNLLTDAQRAELRKSMEESRDKFQELEQKIRDARRELNEALYAEKYDEAATRQKATAVAQLEAERVLLRAKAFDKIRPTVTAAQLERLKRMPLDAAFGPALQGGQGRPFPGPGQPGVGAGGPPQGFGPGRPADPRPDAPVARPKPAAQ